MQNNEVQEQNAKKIVFSSKVPLGKGSAAMGFEIKEIKRQSRAVKVTHPPAERRQLHGQQSWPLHKRNEALAKWNDFTSKAEQDFGEDVKKNFVFEWRAVNTAWREALRLRSPFLPQAQMVEVHGILQNKSRKVKTVADYAILMNIGYSSENISNRVKFKTENGF